MTPELDAAVAAIYADRDRGGMAPTIAAFTALQAAHPEEAQLVYEVAGGYDRRRRSPSGRSRGASAVRPAPGAPGLD